MAFRSNDPKFESVTASESDSAGNVDILAENTSNTASSKARVRAKVAGASADDAVHSAEIDGVQTWSWGIDNSDSDNFVIAASDTLGTSNALAIDTSGNAELTGTLSTDQVNEKTSGVGVEIEGVSDGSSVTTGYVGEVVSKTDTTNRAMAGYTEDTWYVDATNGKISLTAGHWLVFLNLTTYLTHTSIGQGIKHMVGIKTTSTSELTDANVLSFQAGSEDLFTTGAQFQGFGITAEINVSSSQDLFAAIRWLRQGSAATVTGLNYGNATGALNFFAVRIR